MTQHAPLEFVPRELLDCASRLHESEHFPVTVPAETFFFLKRLSRHCDHSTKPLGRFLLLIRPSQLEDAILRIVLPPEFHQLLTLLGQRQRDKEDAIADADFERARELRDTTNEIKSQLAEFVAPSIEIAPQHIVQAIQDLGYADPIDI